jgi:hypothetical protein
VNDNFDAKYELMRCTLVLDTSTTRAHRANNLD